MNRIAWFKVTPLHIEINSNVKRSQGGHQKLTTDFLGAISMENRGYFTYNLRSFQGKTPCFGITIFIAFWPYLSSV